MKNSVLKATRRAILALVFVATSAAAQSAASGSVSTTTSSEQHDTSHKQRSRADVVEQRISDMHAQLKINDQQSQQWEKFAQTMRDNAQTADRAFRARMQTFSSLNADESMKSYAALAHQPDLARSLSAPRIALCRMNASGRYRTDSFRLM